MKNRIPLLAALFTLFIVALPLLAQADAYERYRHIIDDYPNQPMGTIDSAISSLSAAKSSELERDYLLGMLYFIRGFRRLSEMGPAGLKDAKVRADYAQAEAHYKHVESQSPGYKYVYCKYAELYRFSFNEEGFRRLVRDLGSAPANERTAECRALIEEIAMHYAAKGHLELSRSIFETAVNSWNSYPSYMLGALGELEQALGNPAKASRWWKRCLAESAESRVKARCEKLLSSSD